MADEVVIIGQQGGEDRASVSGSDDLLEALGLAPDEGGSRLLKVELLKPVSPWGTPLRLRDEWTPLDVHEWAQRMGGGRYRFRARRQNGQWGPQVEISLHGPPLWERKFREYSRDHETAELGDERARGEASAQASAQASQVGMVDRMLALQAESNKAMIGLVTAIVSAERQAPQGRQDPPDYVSGLDGLLGLVDKLRGMAEGGSAAGDGGAWSKVGAALAPAFERLGEGLGRAVEEREEEGGDAPAREDRQQLPSREPTSRATLREAPKASATPSAAQQLEILKQLRTVWQRGAPALLAAELLTVVHPVVAASILERGRQAVGAWIDRLVAHAPELDTPLGRRWLELVAASVFAEAAGEEPPELAGCAVDVLEEELGSGGGAEQAASSEAAPPPPEPPPEAGEAGGARPAAAPTSMSPAPPEPVSGRV